MTVSLRDLRSEFPALAQTVEGRRLAYLDTASTALKPRAVIEAVRHVYERDAGSVHRGLHTLSQRASSRFEEALRTVAEWLGATPDEVVFVRSATEALNLGATGYFEPRLGPGDCVVVTALEHHANLLPWQRACARTGARLVVVPTDGAGSVQPEALDAALEGRPRVLAVAHASNLFGRELPVRALADRAHARGALVVVDGAQAAPHVSPDVAALGADFYALSGHKAYGPSGASVLWGRRELLEGTEPLLLGGGAVLSVTHADAVLAGVPERLEAGTPAIEGVVGLAAAITFLRGLGAPAITAHEHRLARGAAEYLRSIPGVRVLGVPEAGASQVTFVLDGVHAHDVASLLDEDGVAVRAGHLCAQPAVEALGLRSVVRASFGVYTDDADVAQLAGAVAQARKLFGRVA